MFFGRTVQVLVKKGEIRKKGLWVQVGDYEHMRDYHLSSDSSAGRFLGSCGLIIADPSYNIR